MINLDWIPAVVSATGTIIASWFAYNQYTKNKMTDAKIEKWKANEEKKNAERSSRIASIYGVLWELLHSLKADRVFILQPHPLVNSMFISISLEVKRNGVAGMKDSVQQYKMSDLAGWVGVLSSRDFLYYPCIETDMPDKRGRALAQMHGTEKTMIKRMSDDGKRWIGSLFVEFTSVEKQIGVDFAKKEILNAAINIQYILPEFKIEEL